MASREYETTGYLEPIGAAWNIKDEATLFVKLYLARPSEENLDKIRKDLLMTVAHYDWLVREFPSDAKTIGRILRKRQQTLDEFERKIENVRRGNGTSGHAHHQFVASKALGSPYRNGSRDYRRAVSVPSRPPWRGKPVPARSVGSSVEV